MQRRKIDYTWPALLTLNFSVFGAVWYICTSPELTMLRAILAVLIVFIIGAFLILLMGYRSNK